MKMFYRRLFTSFLLFVTLVSSEISGRKVFMLVLDGLVHDFKKYTSNTPHLDRIIEEGITAERLTPPFPPNTLPAMTTLMTGMYPETHGILNNEFVDVATNSTFAYYKRPIADSKNNKFFTKEPIWLANQKQGGSSAVYYIPGYYAYKERPDFYDPYLRRKINKLDRARYTVYRAIDHLFQDGTNLAIVNMDFPDGIGHTYGSDSKEYIRSVEGLDKYVIGYLWKRYQEFKDDLDIIVVSDHGFVNAGNKSQVTRLYDHVERRCCLVTADGASTSIWQRNGCTVEQIVANLTKLQDSGHFKVYRKEEIPEYLHYKNNPNIPSIIVLAEPGWLLVETDEQIDNKGFHGYDNHEMSTVFMAMGPSFKKGVTTPPFDSVHVAPLVAHLLGIEIAPNNGTVDVFKGVLNDYAKT